MTTPDAVRRLRNVYTRKKRSPPNPLPAMVTIQGFNIRDSTPSPPKKTHSPRKSALRVNLVAPPSAPMKNYSKMSKNEIQRMINSGSNNRRMLEKIWMNKTIEQNSFNSIRKILDSGAIRSQKDYSALESAWFDKLIKYGTTHNLNSAMKMNTRYSNSIANAWSMRRIPTKNISRLVNRVPSTTRMGYNTVGALLTELKRRHAV
jgi:hypothetical protein